MLFFWTFYSSVNPENKIHPQKYWVIALIIDAALAELAMTRVCLFLGGSLEKASATDR